MGQEQLTTAALLTSARPAFTTIPQGTPKALPSNIALKATPAPALGPQDELLFDPDEESYGNAGPGEGYVLNGTNIPLGVQTGQRASVATPTSISQSTAPLPSVSQEQQDPLIVDLEDPKPKSPESQGNGVFFWIVLITVIITCILCILVLMFRGGSRAADLTSSVPPSMDSLGLGDLGGGGYSGGL